eukprot:s2447_g2.t1
MGEWMTSMAVRNMRAVFFLLNFSGGVGEAGDGGDVSLRRHEGSAATAGACPEDDEDLAGMRVGTLQMMQHGVGRRIKQTGRTEPNRKSRQSAAWKASLDAEDPTKQVKRSNIAERQFLATDGADGQTVFHRERSAARNRLQKSVVAAAEYRAGQREPPATDDRDLEEIEQDVEEAINIAVANGEFDNLEGKGKPLKSLLGAGNPYLDPADRIGYGLLQKHGYAPEWIEQQKRIHRDAQHFARSLSEAWAASKFEPTAAFVTQKDRFRQEIAKLNKRVRDYNLNCPASAQMVPFDTVEEVRKAKREAERHHAEAAAQRQRFAAGMTNHSAKRSLLQQVISAGSSARLPASTSSSSVWSRVAGAFRLGSPSLLELQRVGKMP